MHEISDRLVSQGEIRENGGRIVCPRPKLAKFANLHYFFPPATEQQIASVAQLTERQPRQEFRAFLALHNGLDLFGGSLTIYGIREHYDRDPVSSLWLPYDLYPENFAPSFPVGFNDMVIGGIGDNGRIVLAHTGEVLRFEMGCDEQLECWPDLATFLAVEAARFDTFYDAEGYLKAEMPVVEGKAAPRIDMNMYELSKRADRWDLRFLQWLRGL